MAITQGCKPDQDITNVPINETYELNGVYSVPEIQAAFDDALAFLADQTTKDGTESHPDDKVTVIFKENSYVLVSNGNEAGELAEYIIPEQITVPDLPVQLNGFETENTYTLAPLLDKPNLSITPGSNLTVTECLSSKEEQKIIENGASINMTGTEVMFNSPVTTELVYNYSDTYLQGDDYTVIPKTNGNSKLDYLRQGPINHIIYLEEGVKFDGGKYLTNYDPDASFVLRMTGLAKIRLDTIYFNNSLTSDSTSYLDINGGYITNLIHQR